MDTECVRVGGRETATQGIETVSSSDGWSVELLPDERAEHGNVGIEVESDTWRAGGVLRDKMIEAEFD